MQTRESPWLQGGPRQDGKAGEQAQQAKELLAVIWETSWHFQEYGMEDNMRHGWEDQRVASGNTFLGMLIKKKDLDMQVKWKKIVGRKSESDLIDGNLYGMYRIAGYLIWPEQKGE